MTAASYRRVVKRFCADESGAVTVDWVVLTATVVALGFAVMNTVGTGVNSATSTMTTKMSTASSAGSGN